MVSRIFFISVTTGLPLFPLPRAPARLRYLNVSENAFETFHDCVCSMTSLVEIGRRTIACHAAGLHRTPLAPAGAASQKQPPHLAPGIDRWTDVVAPTRPSRKPRDAYLPAAVVDLPAWRNSTCAGVTTLELREWVEISRHGAVQ